MSGVRDTDTPALPYGTMAEYSRAEAVRRAGVEPAYLDRLIELAIITPGLDGRLSKGDVRRAQMTKTLETAGLPLEALAAALPSGRITLDFMDSPIYERFATLSDQTFRQVSERTGLPLELLMLIREATGSAAPNPDDLIREDELAVVPSIASRLALGFRPQSIERSFRVLGDSLRRTAETESDAWRSDLMEPMLAAGMTATELGRPRRRARSSTGPWTRPSLQSGTHSRRDPGPPTSSAASRRR
jgi:hypothetical protein